MGSCEKCNDEMAKREKDDDRKAEEAEIRMLKKRSESPEKWMKGIPKRYLRYSFDNFKGGEAIKNICRQFSSEYPETDSLLFTGDTGCGKTHLAMATFRDLIVNGKVGGSGYSTDFDQTHYYENLDGVESRPDVCFTTVPELLLELRRTFKDGSKESEESVIGKYAKVKLLILDDLGSEKASEFAIQSLYLLIDRRNRDLKPTIVTTNLSLNEIEDRLNGRIASRLAEMKIIKINMPDHRKMRKAGRA